MPKADGPGFSVTAFERAVRSDGAGIAEGPAVGSLGRDLLSWRGESGDCETSAVSSRWARLWRRPRSRDRRRRQAPRSPLFLSTTSRTKTRARAEQDPPAAAVRTTYPSAANVNSRSFLAELQGIFLARTSSCSTRNHMERERNCCVPRGRETRNGTRVAQFSPPNNHPQTRDNQN